MSNELVRQALELDDRLSAPSKGKKKIAQSKTAKRRERRIRARSLTAAQKDQGRQETVERNVQALLKNRKKAITTKRKLIEKVANQQVPKWQLPAKKKKKVKKEDKIPDSAYDISDVLL
ncbi:uncharacterized protein LOC135810162 [Sycon ciliatum]|uniref:uncharacterized protein LOC135810162 n=1 Tax=Sycon ciliatum TaxID=27933 RepID=UPI0020ABA428|eukprot:scpid79293/ scgid29661/ 